LRHALLLVGKKRGHADSRITQRSPSQPSTPSADYGLSSIPQSREQPMLDPETLWHIAPEMNVVAVPPPVRKVRGEAIAILNARRAGNRGKPTTVTATEVPVAAADAAPQFQDPAPAIIGHVSS
jgi:hypothetical protein